MIPVQCKGCRDFAEVDDTFAGEFVCQLCDEVGPSTDAHVPAPEHGDVSIEYEPLRMRRNRGES